MLQQLLSRASHFLDCWKYMRLINKTNRVNSRDSRKLIDDGES